MAVYAEWSPLPRHRGLLDHLFLLRDSGVLSAAGSAVFASPFRVICLSRSDGEQRLRGWTQTDTPPQFRHRGRRRSFHGWMLGLRCQPWRCAAPAVAGRAQAAALTAAVERAASLDQLVAVLDAWADTLPWRPAAAQAAGTDAVLARAASRVGALASARGISARSLQRQARRCTGLPPKQWLGLQRFHSALQQVACGGEALAQVAAALGYADQPHLNRDFRMHAGTSPGRLRAAAAGQEDHDAVRFFQEEGTRRRLRLLISSGRPVSDESVQSERPAVPLARRIQF